MEYYDALMTELGSLPGVRSVAGTTNIPFTGEVGSGSIWRTDAPGAEGRRPPTSAADQWKAVIQIVTPRYFETLGIPLLGGRAFDAGDRMSLAELADLESPRPPGVAIINEATAKRFWPGEDPLGKRLFVYDDQAFAAYRTIVGVVQDARAEAVETAAAPTVFLPFGQHPGRGMSLVVRSDLPPVELAGAVTSRLRAYDAALSISSVRPLEEVVSGTLARPRFTLFLVGGFALLALVIASVGVFGIVGYLVTRRTQEIGIRVALGASPGSVLGLVLREGLRPVLLGLGVGGLAAVVVARAMRSLLYELAPLDGPSFVTAAAVLLAVSCVSAVVPARRAAGVDPLHALRSG
jgi:putative ABC transport system permease protein